MQFIQSLLPILSGWKASSTLQEETVPPKSIDFSQFLNERAHDDGTKRPSGDQEGDLDRSVFNAEDSSLVPSVLPTSVDGSVPTSRADPIKSEEKWASEAPSYDLSGLEIETPQPEASPEAVDEKPLFEIAFRYAPEEKQALDGGQTLPTMAGRGEGLPEVGTLVALDAPVARAPAPNEAIRVVSVQASSTHPPLDTLSDPRFPEVKQLDAVAETLNLTLVPNGEQLETTAAAFPARTALVPEDPWAVPMTGEDLAATVSPILENPASAPVLELYGVESSNPQRTAQSDAPETIPRSRDADAPMNEVRFSAFDSQNLAQPEAFDASTVVPPRDDSNDSLQPSVLQVSEQRVAPINQIAQPINWVPGTSDPALTNSDLPTPVYVETLPQQKAEPPNLENVYFVDEAPIPAGRVAETALHAYSEAAFGVADYRRSDDNGAPNKTLTPPNSTPIVDVQNGADGNRTARALDGYTWVAPSTSRPPRSEPVLRPDTETVSKPVYVGPSAASFVDPNVDKPVLAQPNATRPEKVERPANGQRLSKPTAAQDGILIPIEPLEAKHLDVPRTVKHVRAENGSVIVPRVSVADTTPNVDLGIAGKIAADPAITPTEESSSKGTDPGRTRLPARASFAREIPQDADRDLPIQTPQPQVDKTQTAENAPRADASERTLSSAEKARVPEEGLRTADQDLPPSRRATPPAGPQETFGRAHEALRPAIPTEVNARPKIVEPGAAEATVRPPRSEAELPKEGSDKGIRSLNTATVEMPADDRAGSKESTSTNSVERARKTSPGPASAEPDNTSSQPVRPLAETNKRPSHTIGDGALRLDPTSAADELTPAQNPLRQSNPRPADPVKSSEGVLRREYSTEQRVPLPVDTKVLSVVRRIEQPLGGAPRSEVDVPRDSSEIPAPKLAQANATNTPIVRSEGESAGLLKRSEPLARETRERPGLASEGSNAADRERLAFESDKMRDWRTQSRDAVQSQEGGQLRSIRPGTSLDVGSTFASHATPLDRSPMNTHKAVLYIADEPDPAPPTTSSNAIASDNVRPQQADPTSIGNKERPTQFLSGPKLPADRTDVGLPSQNFPRRASNIEPTAITALGATNNETRDVPTPDATPKLPETRADIGHRASFVVSESAPFADPATQKPVPLAPVFGSQQLQAPQPLLVKRVSEPNGQAEKSADLPERRAEAPTTSLLWTDSAKGTKQTYGHVPPPELPKSPVVFERQAEADPEPRPETVRPEGVTGTGSAASIDGSKAQIDARQAQSVSQQLTALAKPLPDSTVEISLKPEELGRVRMTLSLTETGLHVAILAERPETSDMMRRNLDLLLQDFRNLGYQDISFDFGNRKGDDGSRSMFATGLVDPSEVNDTPEFSPDVGSAPTRIASGRVDLRL